MSKCERYLMNLLWLFDEGRLGVTTAHFTEVHVHLEGQGEGHLLYCCLLPHVISFLYTTKPTYTPPKEQLAEIRAWSAGSHPTDSTGQAPLVTNNQ